VWPGSKAAPAGKRSSMAPLVRSPGAKSQRTASLAILALLFVRATRHVRWHRHLGHFGQLRVHGAYWHCGRQCQPDGHDDRESEFNQSPQIHDRDYPTVNGTLEGRMLHIFASLTPSGSKRSTIPCPLCSLNRWTWHRACESIPPGTARDPPRSMIMSEEDSHDESNFVLLRDPGFWVAQVLACGLIVISGLVIWYVQS